MKYGKYRINMIENSSYVDKENAFCNVGEGIQALAMDYIFDRLGIPYQDVVFVKRDDDFKDLYQGEILMPVHMGVYGENKMRLPLPENVTPLFTSMVVYYDFFDDAPELLAYFKKNEPIGCRDEHTKKIFTKHGVKAYLMGCFTICFPKREKDPIDGKVFLIDTPVGLEEYLPKDIKADYVKVTHSVPFDTYPVTVEEDSRQKQIARKHLEQYRDEAKLVITGRLHAAIPCMAMGIPVILVRENYDFRFGWVEKYLPLYTMDDITDIDWNPKSISTEYAKEHIVYYLEKAIFGVGNKEKELQILDSFYEDREKAVLNKNVRRIIQSVMKEKSEDTFRYAIWGAGAHCRFVHDILEEMYPTAELVVVVDKYIEGTIYNTNIIKGNQLKDYNFDHVFITTLPGKNEAIVELNRIFKGEAEKRYSIITTQMKS